MTWTPEREAHSIRRGLGIGRATAHAFAEAGAHVLGVGRRQRALDETAAHRPAVGVHAADLRDAAAPQRVIDAAIGRWGRLDVLVNNAGATRMMPLDQVTVALALGLAAGGGVVAFLVAWCVHLAGSGARLAARITAVLAAVAFAPAAWVVAVRLVEIEAATADAAPSEPTWSAWTALVSGTVFGLGLLAGLAAFRAGPDRRARTVLTAGGLTALALVAAGLQSFSYGTLTGVAPKSPNVYVYEAGFRLADFGRATAASTVLLIALAFLGIGAALLFVLARVRIDVPLDVYRTGWLYVNLNQRWYEPRTFRVGPGIGAIVLIALFAVGTLLTLGPWLTRAADGPGGSFGAWRPWRTRGGPRW